MGFKIVHFEIFLSWKILGSIFLGSLIYSKFVTSRCALQTSNGFFCSVNYLSGGGINANHNAKHSPCLACKNKTENDSRLLKNSEGNGDDERTFCRGQETRIRMIRKIFQEK